MGEINMKYNIGDSLCELEDFLDKIQKSIHHNRKGWLIGLYQIIFFSLQKM